MTKIDTLIIASLFSACPFVGIAQQTYIKHVEFPVQATIEQKIEMAACLVPTSQQLAWQQMELTAFLHFGINTFTGREWGDGTENPALFNPSQLDAEQWVKSLKEAGFKMAIITAKHHDGFCLWPTRTTKHSVASSPWKEGKGDVVKELRDACTKHGMKFGVYLSPWDRNAACYGDSPRYNQFFIEQLTELLTNYGEIHEVWFDGANGEGPNGKKQEYDWEAFYSTIHRLQPHAVTAIKGDDVRWVGNEKGLGRETEWSATVLTPGGYVRASENNRLLGINSMSTDLGSRSMVAKATEMFWYPSEVDVSIRPGWFYHEAEDGKVKSLKQLVDIYFQSVGYNSVLLMNIPPDLRGKINEHDVRRLNEFATYRQQVFDDNKVLKGEDSWIAAAGESRVVPLRRGTTVNVIMLQEDISKGQRVENFIIEALVDGKWQYVTEGTTIGYKRLLRIPDLKASSLRVKITSCRLKANISNIAAYYAPPVEETLAKADWNELSRETWTLVSAQPFVVDLGKEVSLKAFTYAPLNEVAKPTMAYRYHLYVSPDGKQWNKVLTNGEFSNIMHNPLPQTVQLNQPINAKYIKIEATTPEGEQAQIDLNEIGVTLNE